MGRDVTLAHKACGAPPCRKHPFPFLTFSRSFESSVRSLFSPILPHVSSLAFFPHLSLLPCATHATVVTLVPHALFTTGAVPWKLSDILHQFADKEKGTRKANGGEADNDSGGGGETDGVDGPGPHALDNPAAEESASRRLALPLGRLATASELFFEDRVASLNQEHDMLIQMKFQHSIWDSEDKVVESRNAALDDVQRAAVDVRAAQSRSCNKSVDTASTKERVEASKQLELEAARRHEDCKVRLATITQTYHREVLRVEEQRWRVRAVADHNVSCGAKRGEGLGDSGQGKEGVGGCEHVIHRRQANTFSHHRSRCFGSMVLDGLRSQWLDASQLCVWVQDFVDIMANYFKLQCAQAWNWVNAAQEVRHSSSAAGQGSMACCLRACARLLLGLPSLGDSSLGSSSLGC